MRGNGGIESISPDDPGLPISDADSIDCKCTNRNPSFPGKLKKLALRCERELPSNVQVTFQVGTWGGDSSYDTVGIKVFGPDGEVVGKDEFYRSNPILSLIPGRLRDDIFFKRVRDTAERMAGYYSKDPNDPRLTRTRKYGGCLGSF